MARKQESAGESAAPEATKDRLYSDLVKIRLHGPYGVAEPDLGEELLSISNLRCPDATALGDRLTCVLRMAIAQFHSDNYERALSALYGLEPEWARRKHGKRLEEALKRHDDDLTTSSYERHYRKTWTNELADRLRALGDERAAPELDPTLETSAQAASPGETSETPVQEPPLDALLEPASSEGGACDSEPEPPKQTAVLQLAPYVATPRHRSKHRALIVRLAIAGVLIAVIATAVAYRIYSGPTVPKPGSVIDAANGKLSNAKAMPPAPRSPAQISAGPGTISACIPAAGCAFPQDERPLRAHIGDTIKFSVMLDNPTSDPLPYAKVYVLVGSDSKHLSRINVQLMIEWPRPDGGIDRPHGVLNAVIDAGAASWRRLRYVAGSTELHDREHRRIARLPDGILGSGVELTQIGSPKGCISCDLTYLRFIEFKARIV